MYTNKQKTKEQRARDLYLVGLGTGVVGAAISCRCRRRKLVFLWILNKMFILMDFYGRKRVWTAIELQDTDIAQLCVAD